MNAICIELSLIYERYCVIMNAMNFINQSKFELSLIYVAGTVYLFELEFKLKKN